MTVFEAVYTHLALHYKHLFDCLLTHRINQPEKKNRSHSDGQFSNALSVWPTPITWLWQSHFSHSPLLIGDEIQQVVSATTYGLNAQSCVPVIYTTNICDCVSKKMWNFKSGKWGNKDSFYSSQVLSVILKKMYRFYTFKSKSFFVFCCWQVVPTHMTYSHLVISK